MIHKAVTPLNDHEISPINAINVPFNHNIDPV